MTEPGPPLLDFNFLSVGTYSGFAATFVVPYYFSIPCKHISASLFIFKSYCSIAYLFGIPNSG